MQTLDSLIKQHGYTSLDECIELHSNEILPMRCGCGAAKIA